jgi:hypothetical protein
MQVVGTRRYLVSKTCNLLQYSHITATAVSAVDCSLNFVVFVHAAVGFSTRKKKLATNWVKSYFVLKHVLGFIPFCNTYISTPSFHFTPKYTPTLIFVSVFPRSDITYIDYPYVTGQHSRCKHCCSFSLGQYVIFLSFFASFLSSFLPLPALRISWSKSRFHTFYRLREE